MQSVILFCSFFFNFLAYSIPSLRILSYFSLRAARFRERYWRSLSSLSNFAQIFSLIYFSIPLFWVLISSRIDNLYWCQSSKVSSELTRCVKVSLHCSNPSVAQQWWSERELCSQAMEFYWMTILVESNWFHLWGNRRWKVRGIYWWRNLR